MPIKIVIDKDKNRTTHISTGNITFAEALSASRKFFSGGQATRDLVLDMRQASMDLITSKEIEQLTEFYNNRVNQRPENPRTALVVADTVNYGLSRIVQSTAQLDRSPTRLEIFSSAEDAEAWLDSPPDPAPA